MTSVRFNPSPSFSAGLENGSASRSSGLNKTGFLVYNANYGFGGVFHAQPVLKTMAKETILKLTLSLYRVTELFPEREPLKFSIRRKALKILSALSISKESADFLSLEEKKRILKKSIIYIEQLGSFFELAKEQNWVDSRNFTALGAEYGNLDRILRGRHSQIVQSSDLVVAPDFSRMPARIDRRMETIEGLEEQRGDIEIKRDFFEKKEDNSPFEKRVIEALKENGKMRSSQIKKVFPDVNRRSMLRKLSEMKEKNMIDVTGSGPNIFYFQKG